MGQSHRLESARIPKLEMTAEPKKDFACGRKNILSFRSLECGVALLLLHSLLCGKGYRRSQICDPRTEKDGRTGERGSSQRFGRKPET